MRVAVIEKWVAVADICRCLHNYNALLEITSSLNRSSVFRLKKTWLKVSKQVWTIDSEHFPSSKMSVRNIVASRDSKVAAPILLLFSRQKLWSIRYRSWCHQRGDSKIWEKLWRSELHGSPVSHLVSVIVPVRSSLCMLCPQLWPPLCSLPGNVPDWPGLHRRRNTKLHRGQPGQLL